MQNKFLNHITQLEAENSTSSESHWLLITGIILGSLIGIAGLVFGYFKYRQYRVYQEYSQRPENGIPKEKIGFAQRNKFRFWKFYENKDEPNDDLVKQQQKENYYGQYIELTFLCKPGDTLTIRGDKPVARDAISYFEIEIEDNPRNCDIIIGFCSSKEFQKQFSLGRSQSSVGFHSQTGQVYWRSNLHQDHKFQAVYGETIGIGIRQKDGRVWLSYNGKFLNPPPASEGKSKEDMEKEKKKEEADSEIDIDLNNKNKEIEETRKALILSMGQNLELYPAISVNGRCKINLNVGGMQFRMNQKELKQGLLH
ncbi:unnamed protein product [Paramecium pentaurelia]|uniref:SPRY domain-containing protein n=1 Tax=Paramecium pentaurelia TaxID=43138 RepID=A0A8S1Y362_9CILI|nr:unnamed protein product [Paramecium pentaurelia]